MPQTVLENTPAARLDRLPVLGWHRGLTVLVGLGSFFDLYEVFLGGVLAAVLAERWHLDATGKALVIGSAFAGMFVGANLMSALADRIGRRRVFMINLAGYSLLSVVAAFSPNLGFFVVVRFLCGIGIGSELVLVDTYLAEFLPRAVRGRYISWAYVVGFLGVPVAALFGARAVAKQQILGLEGWRWLLIAGGLGALVVLLVRRRLPESPRWLLTHGRAAEAETVVAGLERRAGVTTPAAPPPAVAAATEPERRVPVRSLFGPDHRRRTVMLMILNILQTVGYYGFGTLAPLVLTAKGYTVTSSLGYSALAFCGYPLGALLAVPIMERFERKRLIIGAVIAIAAFGLVFGFAGNVVLIVLAGFLLTVSSNVFSNAYHTYQAEIFPTAVRSTGVGMCYSLSRAVSALLPFLAVPALERFGPVAVFSGSAVIMVLLCLDVGLLGPRTTGRSLEAVSGDD
ncbi:putative MFS transporter [Friedmanniella endophytica]|uniref:Putative MFS transporter n=1 Tax=Microlunatus kandeliicorticis TaxID=1759536 RepID=A0A7W3P6J0_9ACTN|nr:MFS transporter [Microlunatus kandeliicorticis]MBA8794970.1 putative MFS transporter [Microlunatus kandeliicorticis]